MRYERNNFASEIKTMNFHFFVDFPEIYKNCPIQDFANDIARRLKAEGYDIYIDRMGYGSKRIPKGTPICYRVFKGRYPNHHMDNWKDEFQSYSYFGLYAFRLSLPL